MKQPWFEPFPPDEKEIPEREPIQRRPGSSRRRAPERRFGRVVRRFRIDPIRGTDVPAETPSARKKKEGK